jgi:teichuronic acid biosynthesis protein TuaE
MKVSSKTIKLFLAAAAVIGYAVSYQRIYIFHIFLLLWFVFAALAFSQKGSVVIKQKRILIPVIIFFLYGLLSALWHPELLIWARYQFYFICGFAALFSVYQYCDTVDSFSKIFKYVSFFILLNIAIGLLESLGLFRYPLSPYSPYANYFGYKSTDFQLLGEQAAAITSLKPTGFNGNSNNFVFVVMIALPFLVFHKNFWVRVLGLSVVFWILISVGSRGNFIGFIFFLAILPFFSKSTKWKIISLSASLVILIAIFVLPFFILGDSHGYARVLSAFSQIQVGYSLMMSGEVTPQGDSTAVRAFLYLFGINELRSSPWLGLGLGGIESRLIQESFPIQSFHFFFLQMLIDLGLIMFLFFMGFYLNLIFHTFKISMTSLNPKVRYYAKSISASLLVAIPASISPSGTHYILTYYLLIGFAMSLLKLRRIGSV